MTTTETRINVTINQEMLGTIKRQKIITKEAVKRFILLLEWFTVIWSGGKRVFRELVSE